MVGGRMTMDAQEEHMQESERERGTHLGVVAR